MIQKIARHTYYYVVCSAVYIYHGRGLSVEMSSVLEPAECLKIEMPDHLFGRDSTRRIGLIP